MCVVCTGEEPGYVGGESISRNVQRWDGSVWPRCAGCGGWWELISISEGVCVGINTLDKCVQGWATKYEVRKYVGININLMSGMERHDRGRMVHWDNAGKVRQWGQRPMDQGMEIEAPACTNGSMAVAVAV
jgi:hypothetical protein